MDIKVKIDDKDEKHKKVHLTVSNDVTDPGELHPFLVSEKFVANYSDVRCIATEKTDKNTTFTFKARWIPEKWGGPKTTPPEPWKSPVVKKNPTTKQKKKNKALNIKTLEQEVNEKYDSVNKDD